MPSVADTTLPFWKAKPLTALNREEWESLCDGCARCCLEKLQDSDTDELFYTNIVCRYLDLESCRCTEYARRTELVPDCFRVTPDNIDELHWMPSTCAYRILAEGGELPDWHPLVSGNAESIHDAGIAVRSFAVSELQLNDPNDPEELEAHIIPELL